MIVKSCLKVILDYRQSTLIRVEKWVKQKLDVGGSTNLVMLKSPQSMIDVLLQSVWGIQKGLTRPSTQAKIVRPTPGHNCLGSNTMTASLVTPGMQVSTTSDCEAGEGTVEVDGRILATMIGNFTINDGIRSSFYL